MKKLVSLALVFVCLAILTGLAIGQGPQEKKMSSSQVQKICSQAKMQLLDRLRAVEACDKAEKQGRVKEAKKRRAALKNVPVPFHWDKTSACPDIGPGNGGTHLISCSSGSGGGCAWAVCCGGDTCCWANCTGNGCVSN
jgi:hypothetical protein